MRRGLRLIVGAVALLLLVGVFVSLIAPPAILLTPRPAYALSWANDDNGNAAQVYLPITLTNSNLGLRRDHPYSDGDRNPRLSLER